MPTEDNQGKEKKYLHGVALVAFAITLGAFGSTQTELVAAEGELTDGPIENLVWRSFGREGWLPSHRPKSLDSVMDNTWWPPNFNEKHGKDTVGPWRDPFGSTEKHWAEPIFSDYRLALNGKAAESEIATAPRVEAIAEGKPKLSAEEMGEMVANPLSYLWIGQMQNDTAVWKGDALDALDEDAKIMNTTTIQPVMAMQLTQAWKMIFRPVIPIQSFETLKKVNIILDEPSETQLSGDFERKTGLGDIVLWSAFSNAYNPPFVYGFGPTLMLPTATNKNLGTEKWSAGPMGLGVYIGEQWIVGGVGQHWWSYAGDSDRQSVNLTDFQYILQYRLTPQTNIGMAPNIQVNWDADSGEKLRLPVGLGGSTLIFLGPLPVKIGLEYQYFVKQPDLVGPHHLIRFIFSPVLPAPEWSRTPLFGD